MICKACKEKKFRKMIEESKEAMRKYTAKLKKEDYENKKCKSEGEKSSESSQG